AYCRNCASLVKSNALKSAATLTSLLERAERAERERDESRADNSDLLAMADANAMMLSNLGSQVKTAEARIKELEQALEPFAKIADDGAMIGAADKDEDVWFRLDGSVLKVGDFRRARAV